MKSEYENIEKKHTILCSQRLLMALLGFLGSFQLYSMRMNLSVGVICMTNHTAVALLDNNSDVVKNISDFSSLNSVCTMENGTAYKDGPFAYTKAVRGMILGVFFWGYVLSQIPAGLFVARFSAKWCLFTSILVSSLTVLLFPLAAPFGVWPLVVLRVICGFSSGLWFPCMHQIWSRWSPPNERSLLAGITYAGLHVGNALTLPLAGLLCEYGFGQGWPSIFYLSGIVGFVWCLLWAILAFDTPEEHPRISMTEKKYIMSTLKGQVTTNSVEFSLKDIPWLSILKSRPFWAILVINVAFDWNGYAFLTSTPTYVKDILKFNMAQNGFVSALPYVGMGIMQTLLAMLCNTLQQKKCMSLTAIRKLMNSIGNLVPAVTLIILGYLQCQQRILAVALLTIAISSTSGFFVGAMVNHMDIAPQYAGLLFGLTNTIGALTGFFSPYFIGAITPNGSLMEWRFVFIVSAGIYVVGLVFNLIFSSAEIQPWAIQTEKNGLDKRIIEVEDKETNA